MNCLTPLAATLLLALPAWAVASTPEQEQTGEGNTMVVVNEGAMDSTVIQIQQGDGNFSRVEQLGTANFARTEQLGDDNRAEIYQAQPSQPRDDLPNKATTTAARQRGAGNQAVITQQ